MRADQAFGADHPCGERRHCGRAGLGSQAGAAVVNGVGQRRNAAALAGDRVALLAYGRLQTCQCGCLGLRIDARRQQRHWAAVDRGFVPRLDLEIADLKDLANSGRSDLKRHQRGGSSSCRAHRQHPLKHHARPGVDNCRECAGVDWLAGPADVRPEREACGYRTEDLKRYRIGFPGSDGVVGRHETVVISESDDVARAERCHSESPPIIGQPISGDSAKLVDQFVGLQRVKVCPAHLQAIERVRQRRERRSLTGCSGAEAQVQPISKSEMRRAAAGEWNCPGMAAVWLDESTVQCLREAQ